MNHWISVVDKMKRKSEKRKLQVQFSWILALFFCAFAATSYQSVYLMDIGYTGQQIGVGTSLGSLAGFLVLPLWGMLSDHLGSSRKIFMVCMLVCGMLFPLLPTVVKLSYPAVIPMYVYTVMIVLFRQPANAMLDSWAISELSKEDIGYGAVRMWGSIGYSGVSFFLGIVIGKVVGMQFAFYSILLFVIPLLILCFRRKESGGISEKEEKTKPDFKALIQNKTFLVYLLFTIGLNIYLSVTLIFMGYVLEAAGCAATMLGVATGYRALIEIISMQMCVKLRQKITLTVMLAISGIQFGLEHLLYAQSKGIIMILAAMTLSGLAGGIFYSIGPGYIHKVVAPSVRNTAQSLGAASLAFTGIMGTAVGGNVIEFAGIHTLTNGCAIIIFMLTLIFITYNRKSKNRRI